MVRSFVSQSKSENQPRTIRFGRASLDSVDDRMIGLMRFALACSALIIIYIDPSEPDRFVELTYASLCIYVLYSGASYLITVYHRPPVPNVVANWIDVACFLVFVALSSGTNSIFFFCFFFPVLDASFRGGFGRGIIVAVVSSVLFTVIGYLSAPAGQFEINRFLLRPLYLLLLGYLMAYWGGREIELKKRLSLLRDLINLSNPRFSVGQTVGAMLNRLQLFYDADSCFLTLIDPVYKDTSLFRFGRGQANETVEGERIPEPLERLLLSFHDHLAIIYKARAGWLRLQRWGCLALDLTTRQRCTESWQTEIISVAAKLDLGAFISVPLRYRGKGIGRLYLAARQQTFTPADIDFLMQVVEQIIPVIHNIRLLSQSAVNAAEKERQRLARDLHDSVIQPYIGLQYKLAAIRNKKAEGKDTGADIDRLFQMTIDEISDLRGFVRELKEGEEPRADFIVAVRRFASQFAASYDLDVQVECPAPIEINHQLAAQLVRVIQEGLSNVRKHTNASTCKIRMEQPDHVLRLSIENNNARSNGVTFMPRSIEERVRELQGHVHIDHEIDEATVVKIEIPV